MARTITTDDVITLAALRLHRNMMAQTMFSAEVGVYSLLGIDPANEQEINTVAGFIESDMEVVDLLLQLGISVVNAKEETSQENQQQREGEASGEGAVGGTELDTSDLD